MGETLADLAHPDAWEWWRVAPKEKPRKPPPRQTPKETATPTVSETGAEQLGLF